MNAAEDAAVALGVHPLEIWGDDWLFAVLGGEWLAQLDWSEVDASYAQWCAQQARNDGLRLEAVA